MSLTVYGLHKALSKLIHEGHSHKPVCIDKTSFSHRLEDDGAVILEVECVDGPRFIANIDDDGGTAFNLDGTESGRRVVILKGGAQ